MILCLSFRDILIEDLNETGKTVVYLKGGPLSCTALTIMPVAKEPALLITGSARGFISTRKLDGDQFPPSGSLAGHQSWINCFALSTESSKPQVPDTRGLFVSGSMDNTVRLWNAKSGECLGVYSGENFRIPLNS